MKYPGFVCVIAFVCLLATPCHAENITTSEMAGAIDPTLSHPYLFFSEADKPAMLARIENDSRYGDIMNRALAEGNRQLHTPVESWEDYMIEHGKALSGFRRSNLRAALNLAFLYQMTGEQRYADKAFEFADAVCRIPFWRDDGFHSYPTIYERVWPWNVPDDQVSFSFDIHVGDTAREMALVYDWLYPALDTYRRDGIRGALIEKAILPVRGNYDYHWWATAHRCNWCSVCYSGLGCAAMTLLTENPEFADVVAASMNGIRGYLDSFGVNGGWQEGVSYWSYGFPQCVYFSEALRRVTGGKCNLFEHRTLAENTVTFPVYTMFPNYKSVYFCDSYSRRPGRTYVLNRLAEETGNGLASWYRTNFFGSPGDILDIVWPETTVNPVPPDHMSHHFSSIGWAVMRTDFTDPEHVTVACKAGYHDDPHHGHLDCGNFIVQWRDREFISEAGLRGYDLIYFSEKRWNSPQASSVGHNVVFVNGELQIPAKLKNKPWRDNIGGDILDFRSGDNRDYVLMDPSGAYPGRELKGWRRHITYEKPLITVVLDEIGAKPGSEIRVRFHSKCGMEFRDGYALLKDDAGVMAVIPVVAGDFEFEENRHAFQRVRDNTDFAWIPYFDTVIRARNERTVLGTIILPVDGEEDAARISESVSRNGNGRDALELSFSYRGKKYSYTYSWESGKKEGLCLVEANVVQ